MSLETATYISDLNASNPAATDQLKQADDHLRLIKSTLLATFPNITGPVTATQAQLNAAIPIGIITAWYGSSGSVPSGWHVCDGTTGITRSDGAGTIDVPDLRDRAIVGVKTAGTVPTVGATAGATTASGSTSSDGAHTHTVSGAAHTHTVTVNNHTLTVAEMPAHSHGSGVVDTVADAFAHGSQTASPNAATQNINTNSPAGNLESLTESVGGDGGHSHTASSGSTTPGSATSSSDGAHTHTFASVSVVQPSYGLHWVMKV